LPNGAPFELDGNAPPYLHHLSELGEVWLSSDAVIPSFSRESKLAHIIDQIPEVEREAFNRIGYTIGGMMVFPANRVDRKMTINMARGCHPRIKDRFDLTVECIRRHYLDGPSPLSDTLARYQDFFGLFSDFAGYIDFFHLPGPSEGGNLDGQVLHAVRGRHRVAAAGNPRCVRGLPSTCV
jgi:hypothetical protein